MTPEPADTTSRGDSRRVRPGGAGWLGPQRAFWLGVVLVLLGAFGTTGLAFGAMAVGGQELVSSWPIWSLAYLLSVAVPLGVGFIVASIVARALGQRAGPASALPNLDSASASVHQESRLPPQPSPLLAVLLGTGCILISLIDQNVHFVEYLPAKQSVQRDLLWILLPLVQVLHPLGAALIPGGWLLARIHSRATRAMPS